MYYTEFGINGTLADWRGLVEYDSEEAAIKELLDAGYTYDTDSCEYHKDISEQGEFIRVFAKVRSYGLGE